MTSVLLNLFVWMFGPWDRLRFESTTQDSESGVRSLGYNPCQIEYFNCRPAMDAHTADPWLNFWPLFSEFTVEMINLEIFFPGREIKLTHNRWLHWNRWCHSVVPEIGRGHRGSSHDNWMGFKKHIYECLWPCYQDGGRSVEEPGTDAVIS
jgi:hypothetical protein